MRYYWVKLKQFLIRNACKIFGGHKLSLCKYEWCKQQHCSRCHLVGDISAMNL